MTWHMPTSVDEALRLRADNPDATVVAGGTFVGVLTRQRLLDSEDWISLQHTRELTALNDAGDLSVGAMVTHRRMELDPAMISGWPGLAAAFAVVASPRVRNVATVGGVLADADYASDPPAMFVAARAVAEIASVRGVRREPVEDLITGHYATSLAEDELITRVVVPRPTGKAVYRKLRTRSQEDRPAVAAVSDRPQYFPDVCASWQPVEASAREIADEYAARISYIDDSRGSAAYRRHVVGVEVRRALMGVST